MIGDRARVVGLIGGAAVVAVALGAGDRAAGALAALCCVAGLGAVLVVAATRFRAPVWLERTLCYGAVLGTACIIWGPPLVHGDGVGLEDWGAHRLVVGTLVDSMSHGHFPYWMNAANAGEPFTDLYPVPSYLLAALAVFVFHARAAIPQVLAWTAVLAHVGVALGTVRVAVRVAPWPVAMLSGLAMLVDLGDDSALGATAVFKWALFHEAFGVALLLGATASVLDLLARPRTSAAVSIWVFAALATATYLTCVVVVLASIGALVGVAVLCRRAARHRCVLAAGHLGIGLLLGAIVWQPLAARIGLYSLHFGNPALPIAEIFKSIAAGNLPVNGVPLVNLVGYAGLVAAVASRRPAPVFVGLAALLLLCGLVDSTYLTLGASTASHAVARFSALRLPGLAKPFMFAAGAYGLAALVRQGSRPMSRQRAWLGAAAAAVVLLGLTAGWAWLSERTTALRAELIEPLPNVGGYRGLTEWARDQAAHERPDHYGRLLFEGWAFYPFQLTAETGLPLTYRWSAPSFHNRERLEGTDAESLDRFAIRWVVNRVDHPSLGDAATERCFDQYCVRELPGWTGRLARVRSGAGEARVVALTTDTLTVDVRGTARPALVDLSFAYYPRWVATHDGHDLPVYGTPARADDPEHGRLLSLWLPPGRTLLHCDGALPSDHAGEPAFLFAFALVGVTLTLDRRPRLRKRLVRRVAHARRWLQVRRRAVAMASAVIAGVVLGLLALVGALREDIGLVLARRFAADADVIARVGHEPWQHCRYQRVPGEFACPGGLTVSGVQAYTLHDGEAGWNFVTPGIRLSTAADVEVAITMKRRIGSRLFARVVGGRSATLAVDGAVPTPLVGMRTVIPIATPGQHRFTLLARPDPFATTTIVVMRADAVDVDRMQDVPLPPPQSPF